MNMMKQLCWAGLLPATAFAADPPNIIYIMTDQHTATALSCAGDKDVKTPNIDRLAARGVRFENAYCAMPLSGPSRAAMFTGHVPSEVGLMKNNAPMSEALKQQSLGVLLKKAGYECTYAGKWHVHTPSIPDLEFGFDSIHPHTDYGLAEKCVEYLNSKPKKPFFLVASFDNPHNICEYARSQNMPFAVIDEPQSITDCPNLPVNFSVNPYDAEAVALGKAESYVVHPTANYTLDDWRRYRNMYYRLVEKVDGEIGQLIDAIDANKLWDNTVIIFTADHGDGNGAHQWNQKTALYEEVVNVPFITCWPKQKKAGIVLPQLINNGTDFMVTLLDVAGVQQPEGLSGVSFLDLMKNPDATRQHQPYVVAETLFYNGQIRGWMVRTDRYKYLLYDRGRYREQLYDMQQDRGEMRNLAIESKHKETLKQHRAILDEWMKQHNVSPLRPEVEHLPVH